MCTRVGSWLRETRNPPFGSSANLKVPRVCWRINRFKLWDYGGNLPFLSVAVLIAARPSPCESEPLQRVGTYLGRRFTTAETRQGNSIEWETWRNLPTDPSLLFPTCPWSQFSKDVPQISSSGTGDMGDYIFHLTSKPFRSQRVNSFLAWALLELLELFPWWFSKLLEMESLGSKSLGHSLPFRSLPTRKVLL